MRNAIVFMRALVGFTGLVQIVLGVLFWTGHAQNLVNLHLVLGFVFVLGMLIQAILSARAGAPGGLVASTIVLALVVPFVGMSQMRWMVGSAHWVIRVVHLLLGFGGLALSGALSARTIGRPGRGDFHPSRHRPGLPQPRRA